MKTISILFLFIIATVAHADLQNCRVIDSDEVKKVAETALKQVDKVRDYTCIVTRRELLTIDGQPKDTGYQYLFTKVQLKPTLKIYLEFLKPNDVKGRALVYDGKEVVVRRGGQRMSTLTLHLGIDSPILLSESRRPITEIGLNTMCKGLMEIIDNEINLPETTIKEYSNVYLYKRPGILYRMVHSKKVDEAKCQMAELMVDKKLGIPIYFKCVGWQGQVLEEYGFQEIVVNVGFDDYDFDYRNNEYGFKHE